MVEDLASHEAQSGGGAVAAEADVEEGEEVSNTSALRDNIAKKKQNAYYYAHAHKANGPEWDGKIEPKLLGTSTSTSNTLSDSITTSLSNKMSLLAKSNITNYAFLDEDTKVKVYVELPGVGNCREEDILLDFTDTSLCLTVKNYIVTPASSAGGGGKDEVESSATGSDKLVVDCSKSTSDLEEVEVEEEEEGGKNKSAAQEEEKGEDRCLAFGRLYGEIEKATVRKKMDKIIVAMTKKDGKKWTKVIA